MEHVEERQKMLKDLGNTKMIVSLEKEEAKSFLVQTPIEMRIGQLKSKIHFYEQNYLNEARTPHVLPARLENILNQIRDLEMERQKLIRNDLEERQDKL